MPEKILIIEDEQYLVDMYTMKFESEGYTIVSAVDGAEGLKVAKKEKPNLILLDLIMPKMDGFQVLKALRQDPVTKSAIIYIFSNLGQGSEVERGMAEGANGYFVKSNLTPSQLLKKVKKIFAGEEVVDESDGIKPSKKIMKRAGKIKSPKTKEKTGTGHKVLIIEDEVPILKMYQSRLEKEGMQVEPTANGAWGLKKAKEGKFDIIIMDISMPAMNGFKAIEELRKNDLTKTTPIMVISNSAQDADIAKAKKLGADYFFLKSRITPSRLVKEIKRRLG